MGAGCSSRFFSNDWRERDMEKLRITGERIATEFGENSYLTGEGAKEERERWHLSEWGRCPTKYRQGRGAINCAPTHASIAGDSSLCLRRELSRTLRVTSDGGLLKKEGRCKMSYASIYWGK